MMNWKFLKEEFYLYEFLNFFPRGMFPLGKTLLPLPMLRLEQEVDGGGRIPAGKVQRGRLAVGTGSSWKIEQVYP